MSRAEGGDVRLRLLAAALSLGAREGVGALSIQAIAATAGVSKALVLYHFDDKQALLVALLEHVVAGDVAALESAARAEEPVTALRALAADADGVAARGLLVTLSREAALRTEASARRAVREVAATTLATAVLRSAGLRPRIARALLGQVVLQQLDGLATAGATPDVREGALDAFTLALLSLGE